MPEATEQTIQKSSVEVTGKIPVLNFGTFHMGFTTDANTTEFDENNKENQVAVHQIAEKLASFDPTVIIVEVPPEYNELIQSEYEEYRKDSAMLFENPTEIELLAYEVGRLSGTERIYGIDHKMDYNYQIGNEIENRVDSVWYNIYQKNP